MNERDRLEMDRQVMLSRLDAVKTQGERNKLGQYATPSLLAADVVKAVLPLLNRSDHAIRFLEPGFGTGPFYSALLRHAPQDRIKTASGIDVDPHYALPSRRLWKPYGLHLQIEDFTKSIPPTSEAAKFNLIVCNPPYIRHHHIDKASKMRIQQRVYDATGIRMNGLSGLYTYFMILAKLWMSEGGMGAWLVPSEFMDVNYGKELKRFLLDQVSLIRIHRYDPEDRQFEDALVSSAVVIFRNAVQHDDYAVDFTFGGTLETPRVQRELSRSELSFATKWTQLTNCLNDEAREEDDGATLADLFWIKRGLATGDNDFFVLSASEVVRLGISSDMLTPILPSPRHVPTNEIQADQDGAPLGVERLYLLDCNLPEDEVRSRYPAVWHYLQIGIKRGVNTRFLCRHRMPWYTQEERPPTPFLCTYMGRPTKKRDKPFRFMLNHSNATAANSYLMLYPKPRLSTILSNDPERKRIVWEVLNSLTIELLVGEGRIYGGGLYKIEPKELANVDAKAILKEFAVERSVQGTLF